MRDICHTFVFRSFLKMHPFLPLIVFFCLMIATAVMFRCIHCILDRYERDAFSTRV